MLCWAEYGVDLMLKRLMERRFGEALGSGQEPLSWERVFDETHEMPSRQSNYKHICDRTFLRPRDMIEFCNEVLSAQMELASNEAQFGNEPIHAARERYSSYLLRELDDEIAKHVPAYKEYLEIIKSIGSERLELTDFDSQLRLRKAMSDTSSKDALADLFSFSVISYLKPGGRGGGSEYVWRYKDPTARFDPAVESFRVHPGFKEALGLTR